MWHEIFTASTFCFFFPRSAKKWYPKKGLPQKFNMLLTIKLSKAPLLASSLNICHILDIPSPLAIFRRLCQIRQFLPKSCHFRQNRHSPRGPILAPNFNRYHSGDFSPFFPFFLFHAFLDISVDLTQSSPKL